MLYYDLSKYDLENAYAEIVEGATGNLPQAVEI